MCASGHGKENSIHAHLRPNEASDQGREEARGTAPAGARAAPARPANAAASAEAEGGVDLPHHKAVRVISWRTVAFWIRGAGGNRVLAMKATLIVTVLCLSALAISLATFAQIPQPTTPEGHLARSAGAYLGTIEYIRVFKLSDCAYALPKKFPSLDEILQKEVLPAFPPAARSEMETQMNKMKPALAHQAQEHVGTMIAAAKKDLDAKTACGIAAGMLATIGSQALEGWNSTKLQYGWRGR